MPESKDARGSFFYLQAPETQESHDLIAEIERWSDDNKTQVYVVDSPLGDSRYEYAYKQVLVILIPKRKLTFINYGPSESQFSEYVDDFLEDLGTLSDKYRYRDAIGRPRKWREGLVASFRSDEFSSFEDLEQALRIENARDQRIGELLISLLTGSINDIARVRVDVPENRLDKVKRKILLFDGEQTRFIYLKPNKSPTRIQGLSGTGKTELLFHKLKELYVGEDEARVVLTCHNKILADNLRHRIPDFFDFMKVEQQIKWNERLWCVHAWGSSSAPNSGTYRYICFKYGIPFMSWSKSTPFSKVCEIALEFLSSLESPEPIFDYILIDESQDFPESFFALCAAVTRKAVYIAGDIFQSIFDDSIVRSISPDFLLSKVYRTDPRTLMFAHALGMGLFEDTKLRWLEDEEWKACGYKVDKTNKGQEYQLSREPIRRFEDIEDEKKPSVEICEVGGRFYSVAVEETIRLVRKIIEENPTVTPEDVGIILLDNNSAVYEFADLLQQLVPRETGWEVNKAYETKQKTPGSLFLSNRNNVKGLEFPYVICVTEKITNFYSYRNALYMTLTRSFLQSFIVLSAEPNKKILPSIRAGLDMINSDGCIKVSRPDDEERARINTTIKVSGSNVSFYDFMESIFNNLKVLPIFRPKIMEVVKTTFGDNWDEAEVIETVEFVYERMQRGGGEEV